jgi:cytochrome c-type biogenesis protein CcmH
MTSFLMLAVLLSALALAFIITPLVSTRFAQNHGGQSGQLNLAVLRDQLRELDLDLKQGIIDQAAYSSARHELELRVAQDVGSEQTHHSKTASKGALALLLSVGVLVLAACLYSYLGNKDAFDPAKLKPPAESADTADGKFKQEQINAMLAQVIAHLKEQPDDAKGWAILARSLAGLGRFDEANKAYAKLLALQPRSAEALTDAADALAMSQGQSLQGEPEKLLQRALVIDPKNVKALILLGTVKYERKDYAGAVQAWQQMRALLPPDSQFIQAADDNIRQAQVLAAGGNPATAAASAAAQASAGISAAGQVSNPASSPAAGAASSASAATITGTVELDPALKGQVGPDDTVFVFARAPEGGPRFPLAVFRKQVKDLPLQFTLDDGLAMMPQGKISGFKQVQVGARISKSGNAIPAAGDLEGSAGMVALGSAVKIVINKKRE